MNALKVKELFKLCAKEIEKGNEDKVIMISNDDEGNGYHYLWYSFTPSEEMKIDDMFLMSVNENVASIEDTIVLG